MLSGVLIPTTVAQPNIISSISQHKSGSFVFIIDNPSIRGVNESMLQENRFKAIFNLGSFLLYSENPQNISILSCDIVVLNWIVEVPAIVSEIELGLGVLLPQTYQHSQEDRN